MIFVATRTLILGKRYERGDVVEFPASANRVIPHFLRQRRVVAVPASALEEIQEMLRDGAHIGRVIKALPQGYKPRQAARRLALGQPEPKEEIVEELPLEELDEELDYYEEE